MDSNSQSPDITLTPSLPTSDPPRRLARSEAWCTIGSTFDIHRGENIVIIGSGTSLRGFRWGRIGNLTTIALNRTIYHFPRPWYHLFHDLELAKEFARHQYDKDVTIVCPESCARILTTKGTISQYQLAIYTPMVTEHQRTSIDLWCDCTISTAAIELAWKMGARKILLLGLDAYRQPGATYFWETPAREEKIVEPWMDSAGSGKPYGHNSDFVRDHEKLAAAFAKLASEGERIPPIVNLSRDSQITAWPKEDIDAALPDEAKRQKKKR